MLPANSEDGAMSESAHGHRHYAWWLIMCLCGVDYFSTLGYQPSIAFEGAGLLAPLATAVLVAVTLLCALPVYRHVAGQTPDGVGSVGMIERLCSGWPGKLAVLVLIGFAATDFVITKTLSAADAAAHLVANPLYAGHAPAWMQSQLGVTMFLLVLLGAMFLKGFDEVVGVATTLVVVYLTLTTLIIAAGLWHLATHPNLLADWLAEVTAGRYALEHPPLPGLAAGAGLGTALAITLVIFPKLALGLSGFETGVLHIHLVRGTKADPADATARIAGTRRLLTTAALIMSVLLVGSSLVCGTGTLIPVDALAHEPVRGAAVDRTLAYLAHAEGPVAIAPFFGAAFGTVYDLSTILILWFAGASAMAGLLNMVPRYLPRYGMAPEWAAAYRPLVVVFVAIALVVTLCFRASVAAQGGAYATGVLVLLSSAAVGTFLQVVRRPAPTPTDRRRRAWAASGYGLVVLVFVYTTIANVVERPEGIVIASIFIAAVLGISFVSRAWRAGEIRWKTFRFADAADRMLWIDITSDLPFRVLVPHRPDHRTLAEKEREIRRKHRIEQRVRLVFLEVHRGDVSRFENEPVLSVAEEDGRFVIAARDCVSVSHTIAQVALELSAGGRPLDVIFGFSKGSPLRLAVDFVLFGSGDIPARVVDLFERAVPDPAARPTVIVAS
jgi:hypothetical protein